MFPGLRSIIDRKRRNGQLILLGSASRELVNKSSESLADRIGYVELSPFIVPEVPAHDNDTQTMHWMREFS